MIKMGNVEFTSSIDSSFIPNQCQMFCQNKLCIGEECKEFCNYLLLRVKAPTFCFCVLYYIHDNDINYIVCSIYKLEFKIFIIIEIWLFCLHYLYYIHCKQKAAKNVFNKTVITIICYALSTKPIPACFSCGSLQKNMCTIWPHSFTKKWSCSKHFEYRRFNRKLTSALFCVKILPALEKTILLGT